MKLNKHILGLETHSYSPEQNTLVFICGTRIRTPGCLTIKQARSYLFSPASTRPRVTVTAEYCDTFSYCNKEYTGVRKDMKTLAEFVKEVKARHTIDTGKLLYPPEGVKGVIRANVKVRPFKKVS
jgi:hypothetical protein